MTGSSEAEPSPVLAAGAVLWRRAPAGAVDAASDGGRGAHGGGGHGSDGGRGAGKLEVALVHRPKYDDWSLPKGKRDGAESLPACAVREVREETGYDVALGRPLGVQTYAVPEGSGPDTGGRRKEVHWWAAEVPHDGGSPDRLATVAEVDELAWADVDSALARLTRERDMDLVTAWRRAPTSTTPLVLLRHADTVGRAEWDGSDRLRPLTDAGHAQAAALVPLLAAFGVSRVVSSPAERCLASVRPYAGDRIEVNPAFDEHEVGGAAAAARELLAGVERGVPTVLCTHRPTLPLVLQVCTRFSAVPLPLRQLPKGSLHVLHVADGRIVATETHHATEAHHAGATRHATATRHPATGPRGPG